MDHSGMMLGMFLAGVLLSAPPLVLGIVIGVAVLRHRRAERGGAGRG